MSLADARAADEALSRVPRPRSRPGSGKAPPSPHEVQRRMEEIVLKHLTMSASVTERDLEAAGFSRAEIADHFTAACRAVRAHRLAA
ncbi:hypothetical protein [Reyranella sp.]|uniref:hypothetical protein n=1 Tax=Reyranella sp. TaxID=1929291 RepID=UPI003D0DD8E5